MILYLNKYNGRTFDKIAVLDNAKSVIWVKRYADCGEFEIYINATSELLNLLLKGEIIVTRDDDDVAMYIEKIQLTVDNENGNFIIISGRTAECILARRVINKQTILSGKAENAIRKLLTDNIINPSDSNRKVDIITLSEVNSWTETINMQITGDDLLTAVRDICKSYGYGFKLSYENNKFVFYLYKGQDRSYRQSSNSFVVFSPQFENLIKSEYVRDDTETSKYAYIAGEGEGINRKIVSLSVGTLTGLMRKEIWVDARDISSNDGEVSDSEYRNQLLRKGYEELANHKIITEFNGTIANMNNFVYGKDYFLGDKVSIENQYGIKANVIITEVCETEDETGYSIVPAFEEWSE